MLKIVKNQQCDEKKDFHIVPFNLKPQKVQSCQVSNYFRSSISKDQEKGNLTSCIQGYNLVGTNHQPSDLYECLVYQSEEKDDSIEMVQIAKVKEITEWNHDEPWAKFEGHMGIYQKYLLVQKLLHQKTQN